MLEFSETECDQWLKEGKPLKNPKTGRKLKSKRSKIYQALVEQCDKEVVLDLMKKGAAEYQQPASLFTQEPLEVDADEPPELECNLCEAEFTQCGTLVTTNSGITYIEYPPYTLRVYKGMPLSADPVAFFKTRKFPSVNWYGSHSAARHYSTVKWLNFPYDPDPRPELEGHLHEFINKITVRLFRLDDVRNLDFLNTRWQGSKLQEYLQAATGVGLTKREQLELIIKLHQDDGDNEAVVDLKKAFPNLGKVDNRKKNEVRRYSIHEWDQEFSKRLCQLFRQKKSLSLPVIHGYIAAETTDIHGKEFHEELMTCWTPDVFRRIPIGDFGVVQLGAGTSCCMLGSIFSHLLNIQVQDNLYHAGDLLHHSLWTGRTLAEWFENSRRDPNGKYVSGILKENRSLTIIAGYLHDIGKLLHDDQKSFEIQTQVKCHEVYGWEIYLGKRHWYAQQPVGKRKPRRLNMKQVLMKSDDCNLTKKQYSVIAIASAMHYDIGYYMVGSMDCLVEWSPYYKPTRQKKYTETVYVDRLIQLATNDDLPYRFSLEYTPAKEWQQLARICLAVAVADVRGSFKDAYTGDFPWEIIPGFASEEPYPGDKSPYWSEAYDLSVQQNARAWTFVQKVIKKLDQRLKREKQKFYGSRWQPLT